MRLALVVASLALALPAGAQDNKGGQGGPPAVSQSAIDQAIKKGIEYLKSQNAAHMKPFTHVERHMSHCELVLWTYVHAGVSEADPAFQELFERHPGAPEVLASLERTAQLLSEKLKQHGLAVEVLDRIVKLFPKSEGALKAFNSMARLQRDKLGQSAEAVKTYLRLAEQFGPAGLEALQSAASVARRDLKDYAQEAALRRRIAADFPSAKEAASELLAAGEIYEGDLKDPAKALEVYKELSGKFPGTREARKASERAARLEKKPE